MNALHLPGVPRGRSSPFDLPSHPPPPSALEYTPTLFPEPNPPPNASSPSYMIKVSRTALTKGELTWSEILDPRRFRSYGGAVPGHDVVGTVERIYPSHQSSPPKFAVGDMIWGLIDFDRDGAAATYALAYEHEICLAPTPPTTSQSASEWRSILTTIPLSGLTAYQAIFTHGKLPSPTKSTPAAARPTVLIAGAAGSVGLPLLQICQTHNFNTIALSSARHLEFLKSTFPQVRLIDYTATGFTTLPEYMQVHEIPPADLVIDCVGGSTLQSLITHPGAVKSSGKIVDITAPLKAFGPEAAASLEATLKQRNVEFEFFIVKPDEKQLSDLGELVSQGKLTGYVDEVFPLEKGREAMEKVERKGGVGRGKVVLSVADA